MENQGRFHFVTEVKNELTRISPLYDEMSDNASGGKCCRRAELAALFRCQGSLKLGKEFRLSFKSRNAAVTRRVFALLRAESASLELGTTVARANRLRKRNNYVVTAQNSAAVEELLRHLGFIKDGRLNIAGDSGLLRRECCRRAYLLGAFLGGGSINRPGAQNHLEMATGNLAVAELICELLRRDGFPAGMYGRRDDFVVYLKEGDAIAQFLTMLNAQESAQKLEVAANIKAVRMQVNRLVNVETANMNRAAQNAAKQTVAIERLMKSTSAAALSDELRRTAQARLDNPEATLAELAELLYLSKSGLNHRLQKIMSLAGEGDKIN